MLLFSSPCVPGAGTVLGSGDGAVNKADESSVLGSSQPSACACTCVRESSNEVSPCSGAVWACEDDFGFYSSAVGVLTGFRAEDSCGGCLRWGVGGGSREANTEATLTPGDG